MNKEVQKSIDENNFPILYRLDKKSNKNRFWKIYIKEHDDKTATIYWEYGVEGSEKIIKKLVDKQTDIKK